MRFFKDNTSNDSKNNYFDTGDDIKLIYYAGRI